MGSTGRSHGLTLDRIAGYLNTSQIARELRVLESCTSTNDLAGQAAREGAPHGLTIVADHQTQGRGTQGRVWDSAAGDDLYLSIVVRLTEAHDRLPWTLVPLLAGLAIARSIETAIGPDAQPRPRIKWPNDVLLGEKKCAGVLCEGTSSSSRPRHLVVGIGLNINRPADRFDPALAASSLRTTYGEIFDRSQIAAHLLNAFEVGLKLFEEEMHDLLRKQVTERLAWFGEVVEVDGRRGELMGLDPAGGLRLRSATGREASVYSGTLRRAHPEP